MYPLLQSAIGMIGVAVRWLLFCGLCVSTIVACDTIIARQLELPANILRAWHEEHDAQEYDIGVIGNSMAYVNIHIGKLEKILGKRIVNVATGGTTSAYWYLSMKNQLLRMDRPPRYAIVVFRDMHLTQPTYGLSKGYSTKILSISDPTEPLVDALTYQPLNGRLRTKTLGRLSGYKAKQTLQNMLYNAAKMPAAWLLAGDEGAVGNDIHEAVKASLRESTLNPIHKDVPFAQQLATSYLPEMIRLARERNMQLIFVRVKRQAFVSGKEDSRTKKYMAALGQYLREERMPLIDFTYDTRIVREHYRAPKDDHLTPIGQDVFTKLVAEALQPYVR